MKKTVLIIVVVILVICAAAGGFFLLNLGKPFDPGKTDPITVEIESGSGTDAISRNLVNSGIIKSSIEFKIYSKIKGYDGTFKAGRYSLSPSMSYEEIIKVITSGVSNSVSFTIPEGLTIYDTAEKLAEQGMGDKEKFIKLLEEGDFDYPFLEFAQQGKNKLEGYLLPNTYSVDEGTSEEDIIKVFLDHFQKEVYEGLYLPMKESSEDNLAKHFDINQIVSIASIIEVECKIDEDRDVVSSVIQNRLNIDMPLQMDSTIEYELKKDSLYISLDDLEIDSPYNTYKNIGLPPGAICSPRVSSVEAALNPADTEYIYFVVSSKLDGSLAFSESYEKFLKDKDEFFEAYEKAGGE